MERVDKRLLEIFTQLIEIDATSAAELPVANYITNFFKELGVEATMDGAAESTGGNSGNVIVELNGGGNFLLAAHMDTPRSTKGLKPQFLEDRITSDGTTILGVDNRAGVAAILYGAEKAIKEGRALPSTLLFTVCEETTLGGSEYFEPKESLKFGYVFDSHMRPGNFVSGTCGALRFEATFKGKSAHAGIAPERGVSAIKMASKAIANFPFGWVNDHTNANVGIVNSGNATNVVAEEYRAIGELRSDSVEFGEEVIEGVKANFEAVAKEEGGELKFSYKWEFLPYQVDREGEGFKKLAKTYEKLGLTINGEKSMGGSDANSFNEKGIGVINLGVGAQNPHGNDEFILYDDLVKIGQITHSLLTE